MQPNYNPNQNNFGTSVNPVTGQNTPGVTYNAPDSQNPYGSYSQNAPVNPVISTNVLSQNGQVPSLPQQQQPTQPQSFTSNIQTPQVPGVQTPSTQTQNPQAQTMQVQPLNTQFGDNKGVYNRIQGLYNQLTGKGQRQQALEQQAGLPQISKEVQELSNELTTKKASFDAEANRISGNAMTQEGLIGRTARLRREEAVELGGLSALLQAKQGNLESAKSEIDRTLKFEFEPVETQITALKDFYTMNQNDLSESQKINLQARIARDQKATDFFYDIKKSAYTDALASGNKDLIGAISKAKSSDEVGQAVLTYQAKGSGVPKDVSEKIGKDATAIKTNANIGFVKSLTDYRNMYKKYADAGNLISPEAQTQLGTLRGNLEQAYSVANGQGAIQAGDRDSYSKIIAGGVTFPQLRIKQMNTLADSTLGTVNNNISFLNSSYGGYATPFFSKQLTEAQQAIASQNPNTSLSGSNLFKSVLSNSGTSKIFNQQTGFTLPTQPQQ